ncbi:MAG: RNA polymerase sigma factor [Phycisphaeraceae bacterium]|nr:RNA polymerase sigma factor [Phycisphaeraceae bacterium]MCW5753136.1 RNA polymerase sigma factor [Phycisphaeraceae bacterium]
MQAGDGPYTPEGGHTPVLSRTEFAERYRTASGQLWLVAVSIVRDAALAEDVVQESAIVGLEKLPQFDPRTSFEAWMGQIVRYTALNAVRRERRRESAGLMEADRPQERAAEQAKQDSAQPISTFGRLLADQKAFDAEVLSALEGLDETARACLLLRTVGEAPYARIAELLGIPEGTAMSHVHRSRMAMRERLLKRREGGAA